MEEDTMHYPWAVSTLPDYTLEELAQINLRIHLAARTLTPPARTLALFSSPAVNEIFDTACSLINVADRCAAKRQTPSSRSHHGYRGATAHGCVSDTDPMTTRSSPLASTVWSAIDTALDSSALLMFHASYQAVLGVFEELSASLLCCLAQPQQRTPPQTPPGAPFSPPCSTHVAAMPNVMNQLLSELERAISSLSWNTDSSQRREHKAMLIMPDGFCQGLPSGSPTGEVKGYYESLYMQGGGHRTGRDDVLGSLFSEMGHRQARVRDQVKAVERLLRQPSVLWPV